MKEIYVMDSGRGYYAENNYCYPFDYKTVIHNALIIEEGQTFPKYSRGLPTFIADSRLVFIELDFDPIARIKRGKLFEIDSDCGQPCSIYPYGGGIYQIYVRSAESSTQAYKFKQYDLTRNFNPRSAFFIFGNSRFETRWKIISIDALVTNEELYVIQEVSSIGAIPELNKTVIPQEFYAEIEREYSSLLGELNSSPETVIDHCRDIATSLLSAKLNISKGQRTDLGDLIKKLDENLKIIKNAAEIINRFHPRRKPNEKDNRDLNDLNRSDSDFSVQCVFQIIREFRWHLF